MVQHLQKMVEEKDNHFAETLLVPEDLRGAVELENHQLLSELFQKEN
jgi:hypothetical protein